MGQDPHHNEYEHAPGNRWVATSDALGGAHRMGSILGSLVAGLDESGHRPVAARTQDLAHSIQLAHVFLHGYQESLQQVVEERDRSGWEVMTDLAGSMSQLHEVVAMLEDGVVEMLTQRRNQVALGKDEDAYERCILERQEGGVGVVMTSEAGLDATLLQAVRKDVSVRYVDMLGSNQPKES